MAGIQYRKGDIFDSQAQVLVNTVNCEGFMGKGLALAFKQRYPEMFSLYQRECKTGRLRVGRPTLYKNSTPWILNFPTKNRWRANSKLEYLEEGLAYFVENYEKVGVTSIAFPKLGTHNGKLLWAEVGPLMAKYLDDLDIDIYIYIGEDDNEYHKDTDSIKAAWRRFSEIALAVDLLQQEVLLSLREAKKVAEKRQQREFTSQRDVDAIAALANISVKRIKEYILRQQYTKAELPTIESNHRQCSRKKKTVTSNGQKRKKTSSETELSVASLFSQHEYVS
jgi:O-acetyl-ADP-ribose deacetylase (regulator of RNase III)